jgi:hypothetical protein
MTGCWVAALLERRRPNMPPNLIACGAPGTDDGRMTRHHLLKQQRLRKELDLDIAEYALADPRGMVNACWRHHQLVENRRIVVWREDLPAEFWDFARELGLQGWAERYFPPAPEAARA